MSDPLRLARLCDDDSDDALSPLCRSIVDGEHENVKPRRSRDADMISELAARITRLETANKKAAPRNKKMTRADMTLLAESIGKCLGDELQPLEKRLTKLEARSELKWAGTWFDGMACHEGELITHKGGLWLCIAPSSDRPGDNASAYRLIVKNGSHSDSNGTRRHATTGVRQ